jgi:dTDP-4-amino-4,6-dideoxygalactose transaminase
VCVWWAGQPPIDFDAIRSDCAARGIPLVIDAAHAIGSAYKGEPVAACGDYVCFSFQAVKQLTSGDGGALACSDLQRAKRLRWFGVDRQLPGRFEQDICEAGFKFHMNDIAAAIGLTMLGHLPQTLSAHRDLSSNYDANIDNKRIKKISRLHGQSTSSCWVYSMLAKDRDEFIAHMKSRGVETGRLHVRNDSYSCFSRFKCESLPGVDAFDKELIHIPAGTHVKESDRQQIVAAVNDF